MSQPMTMVEFLIQDVKDEKDRPKTKPCPFCGSDFIMVGGPGREMVWNQDAKAGELPVKMNPRPECLNCPKCGCQGPTHKEIAVSFDLWNMRADDD